MDDQELFSQAAKGEPVASEVAESVRVVIGAAEAAASAVRHEAEQAAQTRRRVAEEEARHYLDDVRVKADAHLQERLRRISELSDTIVDRAEMVLGRLDRAEQVKRQLNDLVEALGQTAERLAADIDAPGLPLSSSFGSHSSEVPRQGQVSPPPEPAMGDAGRQVSPPPEPAMGDAGSRAINPEAAAIEVTEAGLSVTIHDNGQPESVSKVEVARDSARSPVAPIGPGEADGGSAERDPERPSDDELSARLVALQMAVAGGNRGEVHEHLSATFRLSNTGAILDDVFGRGSDTGARVTPPAASQG